MKHYYYVLILLLIMISCTAQKTAIKETESHEESIYGDLIEKGDMLLEKAQYEDAINEYSMAMENDEENPLAYYKLGVLYGVMHQQGLSPHNTLRGKRNRLDRVRRHPESYFETARHYFRQAADLGYREAETILRALYDNIQHKDVKY